MFCCCNVLHNSVVHWNPEPSLTTWQSLSVVHTYFISLILLIVLSMCLIFVPQILVFSLSASVLSLSFSVSLFLFNCFSLSLSCVQTQNKTTASRQLPLAHLIMPLNSWWRWCKYSSIYMFVKMSSEDRSESHYPYYPIISNDR